MDIKVKKEGNTLRLVLDGRLDSVTAADFEKAIKDNLEGVVHVEFDFTKLEYTSSAGLRIMLSTHKHMQKNHGDLVIYGANSEVKDVLRITGLLEKLDVR